MQKNMGSADRIIRTLAALTIGILLVTGAIGGTAAILLGILAVALLGTGAFGFCPLHPVLKISTLEKKSP